MFHLVSATSMALTLFLFSHRLRAKGKWRILSVQTPMLQKAFNSTNWTHTQQSCQAKLLSHVKDQWGGRKMQTPLLSVYANRRVRRGKKQGHWAEMKLRCDANKESLSWEGCHLNPIRWSCFSVLCFGHFKSISGDHFQNLWGSRCSYLHWTALSLRYWATLPNSLLPACYGLLVSRRVISSSLSGPREAWSNHDHSLRAADLQVLLLASNGSCRQYWAHPALLHL